jgi:taurine dioxygenase
MTQMLTIDPMTPGLGAEISGIDVASCGDTGFESLYRAWLHYKIVVIRDQRLDLEALQCFSRRFGELTQLPYIKPFDNYPYIIRVLKRADEIDMGTFGGDWHSDFSFLEAPPKASILYAEEIPPVGGDTLWIDMVQALATLPGEMRERLRGKIAIHSGKPYGVTNAPSEESKFTGSIEIERNNPEADRETHHPAICRHPETGQEMLFVNPTYTTRIDGISETESHELLANLYLHCSQPEFACRVRWQSGSIVIWDNRNTMHYAVNDYDGYRRCLYRTTISGQRPLSV